MGKYKIVIYVIILVVSLFLLMDKIFTTAPIQITLESGQEITTQNSNYYTLTEMLLLVVCAFMTGLSATFLYHNSNKTIKEYFLPKKMQDKLKENLIIKMLKGDEKAVYREILDSNGEMLQNKLVQKTGLSKVKITRIMRRLELKGLVAKERYGLTNKIKLKEPSALGGTTQI